jgi:hypothetical protein
MVLSACVAHSSSAGDRIGTASSTPALASEAAATESTGSLAGLVVDEESAPISGATIGLLEIANETVTDEAGRFTFNGLQPGPHSVVVESLGYNSASRKVDIIPGEVTNVTFTLVPISLDDIPYTLAVPKTGLIHAGQSIVHTLVVQSANNSVLNSLTCDPCRFIVHAPLNPKAVRAEIHWTGSGQPPLNADVFVYYKIKWTNGWYVGENDEDSVIPAYMTNGALYNFPEAQVKKLKTIGAILLVMNPASTGSLEHKPTVWTSYAYNAPFPDDYTALPPK